ncbi:putative acetyltransferase [Thermosporothrix hazakensis]|uniref:Putative acetyltransferase n=1 Tax=Thermosporothrix hazakensis TaxID=644383 RepID=A0A326UA43_THEHA|nr:hypothetical protein [Thermosporothrix hazakensis]PZW32662.1 putative acetyltransferase [Thermosporothrix hazakensis]GCE50014.1 hypothetical protein KTH_48830 [Thermosporothrix hazakensis]
MGKLEDEAEGIGLPLGIPPQQTFLRVKDAQMVVGEIRFRPKLQKPYERYNGHWLQYPSASAWEGLCDSYACDAGRRGAAVAPAGTLASVQGDNLAPVRVILKDGGRLERILTDEDAPVACYLISLA